MGIACSALALTVNALREDGLALVARTAYETLVPCPEPGGPVTPLEPGDPALTAGRAYTLDARTADEFRRWHLPRAVSVPFDYLEPVPEARLAELARAVAASRATRVVVYGDGARPDSGEQLGKELSGRGIRNVCFIRGGAPALREGVAP